VSIYDLPTSLLIDGVDCPIRSDFRAILDCNSALQDDELTDQEKAYVLLRILYVGRELPSAELALEQALWFIDGGTVSTEKQKKQSRKMFDWKQDFPLIISAINRIAGCEIRSLSYLHWWTFLSYWQEMGECLFTRVIDIRQKIAKRKKLEPYEKEFYNANRELIDLKSKGQPEPTDILEEFWASATEGE
jgi:hypothetical protein